jgi:hypothetical protein
MVFSNKLFLRQPRCGGQRTMESAVDEGKVRQLGTANFYRLEDVKWAYAHSN